MGVDSCGYENRRADEPVVVEAGPDPRVVPSVYNGSGRRRRGDHSLLIP